MLFANLMFLGVFVVLPSLLFGFPMSLFWFNSAARHHAGQLPNGCPKLWPVATRVFLPVWIRACAVNATLVILLRSINDPVEGDPPLQPFVHSLDGILIWSAMVVFPFVAYHCFRLRGARKNDTSPDL